MSPLWRCQIIVMRSKRNDGVFNKDIRLLVFCADVTTVFKLNRRCRAIFISLAHRGCDCCIDNQMVTPTGRLGGMPHVLYVLMI